MAQGQLDDQMIFEIPPKPQIIMRLQAEISQSSPDFRRISDMISHDIGLASTVIQHANSAYYGAQVKLDSVQGAISFLGLREVTGIVTFVAVRRVFSDKPDPQMDTIWERAAFRSVLMSQFAQRKVPSIKPEYAHTAGLFQEVGQAVMLLRDGYRELYIKASGVLDLIAKERQHYCIDHTGLGQLLIQKWFLPDFIGHAVRYHHDYIGLIRPPIAPNSAMLIATSYVADEVLRRSNGGDPSKWAEIEQKLAATLGLDTASIEEWISGEVVTA